MEQVRRRDVLRMGVDVQEVDCWGMDCFTRKNVFDGEACVRDGGLTSQSRVCIFGSGCQGPESHCLDGNVIMILAWLACNMALVRRARVSLFNPSMCGLHGSQCVSECQQWQQAAPVIASHPLALSFS